MRPISSAEVLDDSILFELDKLNVGYIKKRIVNELVELKQNNACIDVKYQEDFSNIIHSTILVTIFPNEEDNTIYHFSLTRDYPLKPPSKFTINYKDYKQYLKINSSKTIEELRTYYDIQCLCCISIYRCENWGPKLKMQNMINEFKQIKKYRRYIMNRLLAKKIVDKYLIEDINLMEWLGVSKL